MKVLVVEDEPAIAEMIGRALSDLGNSCLVAHDSVQASAVLARHEVDAVTLDLCMPGANGLDWLEGMAERQPDLARKTLVITGQWLESALVERLARCGAGVLAKPFTLEALRDAVRCQLERKAQDRN
jgi:DNA-binding response OmpR family regulator